MLTLEEIFNKEVLINEDELAKADMEKKIEMLHQAILNVNNKFANVHRIINNKEDGLHPRLADEETTTTALAEENKSLRHELDIAKGLIAKQDFEISALHNKVTQLTARSMRNNLMIGGLLEEDGEDPKETVREFLTEQMLLEVNFDQIQAAHRLGRTMIHKDRPRYMVVRLHPELKDLILSKKKTLKGKKNSQQRFYSIKTQIPDEWEQQRKELNKAIQKAYEENENKDETQEPDRIEVKNRTLYVNKVPHKKTMLLPPKVSEIFPERPEQDKINRMKLYTSTRKEENGSSFIAHALKTQSFTEVRGGYVKLKQMYPHAPHILAAYIINNNQGNQDDREYGASVRILDEVTTQKITNLCVYIGREYEGAHIGPKSHTLIQNAAREAIAKAIQK